MFTHAQSCSNTCVCVHGSSVSLEGQGREGVTGAAPVSVPLTLGEYMRQRDVFDRMVQDHTHVSHDAAIKREEAMLNDDDALVGDTHTHTHTHTYTYMCLHPSLIH